MFSLRMTVINISMSVCIFLTVFFELLLQTHSLSYLEEKIEMEFVVKVNMG